MQVELLTMLDGHRYGLAVAYAASSVIFGYASVHLATVFVRRARTVT
jgi:fluoride ion exporter CrcB/FEX